MSRAPKLYIALLATVAAWPGAALAADSPDRLCSTPLLTSQEQSTCRQEINAATDLIQLKRTQQKYQDMIRKAREADSKKSNKQY